MLGLLAGAGAAWLRASGPGDEVVVVYNPKMPGSKDVADHYAAARGVPEKQIFAFATTTNEDVSRQEFQDSLQRPLAKALESKGLWHVADRGGKLGPGVVRSTIRYAVLCYGVPLRILSADIKEDGAERLRPEMRRNEAAVDSELALLPLLEQKPILAGPLRNLVYAATNEAVFNPTNGVLMVARLDGPSADLAQGLVDKALAAETNGLWGRAYFDLRNTTEPGYQIGDEWIRSASEICRRLGFETTVDQNEATFPAGFPMSQIAIYIGWYAENASGPFAEPTVEFVPGAFAYHLHSYSGATVRSATRNWVGPLVAKGATCTMGSVFEPYLSGTPEVAVFAGRFIYNGFTFGEAALASQNVLSWMTTVVGDPLYRPFGKNPEAIAVDLARRHSDLLPWYYLRVVDVNLANGKPASEMITFLEQLDQTKHSAVLTEKLGDLYLEEGKPSSAVYAYSQALKLDASWQQRLRLRLTLGDKLAELVRDEDACDNYQALLHEYPAYPDRLSVLRKLLPLLQKLKKTADAEKCEADIQQIIGPPKP
jgi:uncharacterized protein (TIGR03790 family)